MWGEAHFWTVLSCLDTESSPASSCVCSGSQLSWLEEVLPQRPPSPPAKQARGCVLYGHPLILRALGRSYPCITQDQSTRVSGCPRGDLPAWRFCPSTTKGLSEPLCRVEMQKTIGAQEAEAGDWTLNQRGTRYSGFSSNLINLSPFTEEGHQGTNGHLNLTCCSEHGLRGAYGQCILHV